MSNPDRPPGPAGAPSPAGPPGPAGPAGPAQPADAPRPAGAQRPDDAQPAPLDQVLRQVALGDESAFDELYERSAPLVWGLILAIVRDPAQAEEVFQEVMVEVWRTAARFDRTRGSAAAWITTMARSRAVDRVRSAQAARERDGRAAAAAATVDFDQTAEAAHANLERRQVRRCLDRLTELQRQAVTLAYFRGLTQHQLAELLAIPVPTVKTRLRDGLIRLRDCLGVSA